MKLSICRRIRTAVVIFFDFLFHIYYKDLSEESGVLHLH